VFAERENHSRVPAKYRTADGFALGASVADQRTKRAQMSEQRRTRLEQLPGWVWGALDARWEEGYAALCAFAQRQKPWLVPREYRTAEGFKLGAWITKQRSLREQMSPERRARLQQVPGWIWATHDARWEGGYGQLCAFAEREKHCLVPGKYTTEDGFKLGSWAIRSEHINGRCARSGDFFWNGFPDGCGTREASRQTPTRTFGGCLSAVERRGGAAWLLSGGDIRT